MTIRMDQTHRVSMLFYVNTHPEAPMMVVSYDIPSAYDYMRMTWSESNAPAEQLVMKGEYVGMSRPTSYPPLPSYMKQHPPPPADLVDAARTIVADMIDASRVPTVYDFNRCAICGQFPHTPEVHRVHYAKLGEEL